MSKYLAMALDPIHIGTGGFHIGRVDNVIVREPATNLPKIPGSSIAGTARTYTTYKILEENNGKNPDISIDCAGQDKEASDQKEKGHCGKCIVCKSFGYSKKDEQIGSRQGLVHFSDGQILLFPVSTRLGPVWVTSPMIIEDFGISLSPNNKPSENEIVVASKFATELNLNLGWLNLPIKKNGELPKFDKLDKLGSSKKELITERIVIVPNNLISQIINSNLEVRTSVSIDPVTGAGKEGALFTSEAIPRSTILWFDIDVSNPKYFGYTDVESNEIKSAMESGFSYFETLGIGGMVTRGFGRIRIWDVA